MSTRLPQPFRYRGRWRAQVTLKNGERPSEDFDTFAQAKAWIADMLANSNTENEPLLGGPTQARLADMLDHYVRHTTLAKGGAVQEINRANHYLVAAGLPELALWESAGGTKEIVTLTRKHAMKREERGDTAPITPQRRRGPRSEAGVLPLGFAQHNEARSRASHPRTYELYATLANKRASQITGADMRALHTTMTAEGYSASTKRKLRFSRRFSTSPNQTGTGPSPGTLALASNSNRATGASWFSPTNRECGSPRRLRSAITHSSGRWWISQWRPRYAKARFCACAGRT